METGDQLLRVCSLRNEHGARYLIVGGHACILHGHVRTTEDVDIHVEDSLENFERVIAGLSALEDHAAAELTPQDIAANVVVKIADEVEVDVSRQAWQVRYADAIETAETVTIESVRVAVPQPRNADQEQDHLPRAGSRGFGAAPRPTGDETPAQRRGELKRINRRHFHGDGELSGVVFDDAAEPPRGNQRDTFIALRGPRLRPRTDCKHARMRADGVAEFVRGGGSEHVENESLIVCLGCRKRTTGLPNQIISLSLLRLKVSES